MQRKEKKPLVKKEQAKQSIEKFLKNIEENRMIDDHGPAIIGRRDKKPNLPEEVDD